MTTTVKEIDLVNRLVTLVQADETPLTLPVQGDVKNLDKLEIEIQWNLNYRKNIEFIQRAEWQFQFHNLVLTTRNLRNSIIIAHFVNCWYIVYF